MRHNTMAVGRHFHPRPHRDILHLRSAFPSGSLNRREVQLSLAGQALSLIYTPTLTTIHEKSGLGVLGETATGELITQRSQVRILSPLPVEMAPEVRPLGPFSCPMDTHLDTLTRLTS